MKMEWYNDIIIKIFDYDDGSEVIKKESNRKPMRYTFSLPPTQ